jgi:hypothetical protein
MTRELLPEPHRASLLRSMREATPRCYAQVATVEHRAYRVVPQLRTITLHHVEELDVLAFSTSKLSAKWSQLRASPRLAGVFFDARRYLQFRWEGPVELADVATPAHADLLRRMWLRLGPGVRSFTWEDYCRSVLGVAPSFDPAEPCPIEGLVLCRPDAWDILRFDVGDYGCSDRVVLTWSGSAWSQVDAPPQRRAEPGP